MFENPLVQFFAVLYRPFIRFGSNFQSLFLLWMRLTWGHQFLMEGLRKLHAHDQTVEFLRSLHFIHVEATAYFITYLELIGGALLILGLATRLISPVLIFSMLVAVSNVHAPSLSLLTVFTHPSSFVIEPSYPYLITSMLVFIFGPGRISLDACIKRWADGLAKY